MRLEAIQQPEVAAGDSDDRSGGDRINTLTGKLDPRRRPVSYQKLTNLARRKRTEFVNEADAGIELRIASQALFNTGHTDQNHFDPP